MILWNQRRSLIENCMRLPAVCVRPTLGFEVGTSLVVSQLAAHHSIDVPLCLYDFAIAHCVYGRDRLIDQGVTSNVTSHDDWSWEAQVPAATTTAAWICSSYYLTLTNQAGVISVLALLVTAYPRIKTSCSNVFGSACNMLYTKRIYDIAPISILT